MASIQHVYRRGHIFWWRRVLCIADESSCDIRLPIAKAEFQNQLARYCDMQREHPQHRAMHSAANLAYADTISG